MSKLPTCIVSEFGDKLWYLNGELHREDGPAIERKSGTKEWWLNGKLHRVGGPAIEFSTGTKMWYLNGICHRADGPAVEYADGVKHWYFNDQFCSSILDFCDAAKMTPEEKTLFVEMDKMTISVV